MSFSMCVLCSFLTPLLCKRMLSYHSVSEEKKDVHIPAAGLSSSGRNKQLPVHRSCMYKSGWHKLQGPFTSWKTVLCSAPRRPRCTSGDWMADLSVGRRERSPLYYRKFTRLELIFILHCCTEIMGRSDVQMCHSHWAVGSKKMPAVNCDGQFECLFQPIRSNGGGLLAPCCDQNENQPSTSTNLYFFTVG